MSNDSFTETTTKGFGTRIKEALMGIVIGPVIIFIACTMLWSNEARNAHMISGLNEGKSSVQEATLDSVDPNLENKFVHLSGKATTSDILVDSDFALSFTGIRLNRNVQMYQWKETSKSSSTDNYGGSSTTNTTYTYSKEWTTSPIDSSSFKEQGGHENPSNWKYTNRSSIAGSVGLGVYKLSTPIISMIRADDSLDLSVYRPSIHSGELLSGNDTIYVGTDPARPMIGDMKVSYMVANPGMPISILGRQSGQMLTSYIAKSGSDITRVDGGTRSASEMIQAAESENSIITWIWRVGGILFIFIGFTLFFRILPILAKIIPPLSWVVGAGVGLVSIILTAIIGGGIIMIAWFAYRPFLSLGILALVAVIVGVTYRIIGKKKDTTTLTAPQIINPDAPNDTPPKA